MHSSRVVRTAPQVLVKGHDRGNDQNIQHADCKRPDESAPHPFSREQHEDVFLWPHIGMLFSGPRQKNVLPLRGRKLEAEPRTPKGGQAHVRNKTDRLCCCGFRTTCTQGEVRIAYTLVLIVCTRALFRSMHALSRGGTLITCFHEVRRDLHTFVNALFGQCMRMRVAGIECESRKALTTDAAQYLL